MPAELYTQLLTFLAEWLAQSRLIDALLQLLALVVVFMLPRVTLNPVHQFIKLIQNTVEPPNRHFVIFHVVEQMLLPMLIGIYLSLSLSMFENLELGTRLLNWVASLATIWLIYVLINTLISLYFRPAQAKFWHQNILRPLTVLVAVLSSLDLLDAVLAWDLSLGSFGFNVTLQSVLVGIAIIVIFFSVSRGLRLVLRHDILPQAGAHPALAQALSMLISYTLILSGVGFGLSAMGIDLTTITVILGGLSVGLGFGLQEIVSNLVSGFILMFEQAIAPGDVIEINGTVGVVEDVGIRSIVVRTRDDVELIVPNSYFLNETITSLTRTHRRVRFGVDISVDYTTEPVIVKEALLEAASREPDVLKEPAPDVAFTGFGDERIEFKLLIWTNDPKNALFLTSHLRFHIWQVFQERGIKIAFPQRDVHIRSSIPLEVQQK